MGKKRKGGGGGRGRGRGPYGGHGGHGGGGGGGPGGGRMNGRMGGYRRFHNDQGPRPSMPDVEIPEGADVAPPEPGSGVLELHPNGYGFLRSLSNNLSRERSDPFVPGTMIEKFRLREGVLIN